MLQLVPFHSMKSRNEEYMTSTKRLFAVNICRHPVIIVNNVNTSPHKQKVHPPNWNYRKRMELRSEEDLVPPS